MRCADAGADIVRITVQGRKEAEACYKIRDTLFQKGYDVPLVADIHFQCVEKRIISERAASQTCSACPELHTPFFGSSQTQASDIDPAFLRQARDRHDGRRVL